MSGAGGVYYSAHLPNEPFIGRYICDKLSKEVQYTERKSYKFYKIIGTKKEM